MGIHGLMKLLSEECPNSIKEIADMECLTGRKVAIDASMALYQFLVAVRSSGPGGGQAAMQLTNEAGEVTSHIQGMFNRTIKMMSSGIKPVYVFDGKPPNLKGGELAKRLAKREKAQLELNEAKDKGDLDEVDKFSRRLIKVTKQHNLDCQELLTYMGVPFIVAPCEAEAQCAELAKKGKVYATATEDMDALTFRTPKLLRKLTFAQGKDKQNILEIDVEVALRGLELSYEQFVDLCILCGCDYCSTIKGIGPKTALKLIRLHKNLEGAIRALAREKKYEIPLEWHPMRVPKQFAAAVEAAETVETDVGPDAVAAGKDKKEKENNLASANENPIADSTVVENNDQRSSSLAAAEDQDDEEGNGVGDFVDDNDEAGAEDDEAALDTALEIVDDGTAGNGAPLDLLVVPPTEEEAAQQGSGADVEYEEVPPLYQQARLLFTHAHVTDADSVELKWVGPDEVKLREFLVEKMGFSLERVNGGIKRLQEAQLKKSQKRMDSFFAPVSSSVSTSATSAAGLKRKADAAGVKGGAAKKGRPMGGRR